MADLRLCSFPDCGKPVKIKSRGLCNMHYLRLMRHGDTRTVLKLPNGVVQKFYKDFVLAFDADECLMWPYARDAGGYGVMSRNKKQGHVSRFICHDVYGSPQNASDEAAHSCGNGHLGCVTKRHLSWKTPKENAQDRVVHGTTTAGERCSYAKLSDPIVREIRALKGRATQKDIAKKFSISPSLVSAIHLRKRWVHVD